MLMSLEEMLSKTAARESSFRLMLDHLRKIENPLIVETGCIRPSDQPWGTIEISFKDDGMSTCIFDAFINEYGGEFHSVDLTPNHVKYAEALVSTKSKIHCGDSIQFLWNFNKSLEKENKFIDLIYMDSFDYIGENPYPSMVHHIKELAVVLGRMKSGSLIAVDDNYGTDEDPKGKGVYIKEIMSAMEVPMIHKGVQCVWRLP